MASEPVAEPASATGEDAVEIWTDGGCRPNPGPGGWAAVLRFRGVERELSGAEPATTNNRMELTAATMALEALRRPCRVVLHTDSEYLKNGVTRWHQGWLRRNWRNAAGDPVADAARLGGSGRKDCRAGAKESGARRLGRSALGPAGC